MDKKKPLDNNDLDDIRGFEEFLEGEAKDSSFLPKLNAANTSKKEVGFEHFTFLTNDSVRLQKLNELLMEKIPFASSYDQSQKIIKDQLLEIKTLKKHIFEFSNRPGSTYRRSLSEIFDKYFKK